ncbi:hypothetical protein [Amorphus sp. 3PC139-8]|uniref:hypothetical protein n=1 Tax=Amorphus sp. 3PC139-8 TaxID=2735676 RepID=UPI00345DFF9F
MKWSTFGMVVLVVGAVPLGVQLKVAGATNDRDHKEAPTGRFSSAQLPSPTFLEEPTRSTPSEVAAEGEDSFAVDWSDVDGRWTLDPGLSLFRRLADGEDRPAAAGAADLIEVVRKTREQSPPAEAEDAMAARVPAAVQSEDSAPNSVKNDEAVRVVPDAFVGSQADRGARSDALIDLASIAQMSPDQMEAAIGLVLALKDPEVGRQWLSDRRPSSPPTIGVPPLSAPGVPQSEAPSDGPTLLTRGWDAYRDSEGRAWIQQGDDEATRLEVERGVVLGALGPVESIVQRDGALEIETGFGGLLRGHPNPIVPRPRPRSFAGSAAGDDDDAGLLSFKGPHFEFTRSAPPSEPDAKKQAARELPPRPQAKPLLSVGSKAREKSHEEKGT